MKNEKSIAIYIVALTEQETYRAVEIYASHELEVVISIFWSRKSFQTLKERREIVMRFNSLNVINKTLCIIIYRWAETSFHIWQKTSNGVESLKTKS